MSSAVSTKILERVLASVGAPISPAEFLAVLGEVVDSTDTLTGPERDFLLEHGGVRPDAFDSASLAEARQRIAFAAETADQAATRDGYTTSEVAHLLGAATANVRRHLGKGDLYASGLRRDREHVFPRWQFHDGKPLPHLREVVAALPADMHPLDVATFMAAPREELGGRTVTQWLAGGGAAEAAIRLADDLARL